jgi:glycosyltransferase involved in cell wall biosynthesis
VKRKLKIVVFHLAFVYSGGGEKLVIEEVKGLRKKGHQVDCFAPIIDPKACFPDLLPAIGVREIIPGFSKIFSLNPSVAVLLTCALFPFLTWRFKNYDLLFGANQPGAWFGYWLKKFYRVPYVVYLAQPTRILYPRLIDKRVGLRLKKRLRFLPVLVNVFRPFIWWADNVSIRRAKIMLVNGIYMRGVLEKIYGRRGRVCPAGCHPFLGKKFQFKSRWQGSLTVNGQRIEKPYVLLTNRHSPQKRFEWAIDAMDEVWHHFPGIQLIITGQETGYTTYLERLVKRNKDTKRVKFLGLVSEKDLARLYREAVLYVYSSPEEDFGMGIIEAMAHGTPVVAWDNAGPTAIVVDGKTGFLAKPFEVGDFAEKITMILADRNLAQRMGKTGWRKAKEEFTYQKHCQRLEKALFASLEG